MRCTYLGKLEKMRILIVEDDMTSLLVLQAEVEQLGHECLTASDGHEAWEVLQTTPVDVIISDWMMPRVDGIELCRRVRETAAAHYTYFIFITSLGEKPEILKGIECGADDYLLKPLDYHELQMRLIVAARITGLHRELAAQSRALETLNREISEQSRTDALTMLGNRLRLREDLEVLAARAARYHDGCCVAMCDIDFFKVYNDTHGHLAGDEVLKAVAQTIRGTARTEDGVYRYGGEEFLLILPEQSLHSAAQAMERIRSAIERLAIPLDPAPGGRTVTISTGIAALQAGETIEVLIARADAALYRAKQAGRNNVQMAAADATSSRNEDTAAAEAA